MSGMHSTFSSSITGDKQHSYAVLSAMQQGSAAEASPPQQAQEPDAASVSSFGSSVSLLKGKLHRPFNNKASDSGKSSSLVARQRAAKNANAMALKSQVRPHH
ncbi:hypothetical protein CMUS01_02442 [Colletotrichum musicola]|uniref:Uncharacterized protein n=1 Tax=Colletotrichum musicola TaxID=2175873 RepID=A0A8H6NV87_9PEZI|nr:hypothetical protein CMUS01_02442 [Colletotrichum musicola]